MTVEFTAHNIRLDDGTFTKPDLGFTTDMHPWFIAACRILETVFPGDKTHIRLADLGCLEGGFSVGFARQGYQVLGIEVRESNIEACNYVKSKTNLPNLAFVKDDAWNIGNYGMFDVVFCCGLLYHLDKPRQFLETISVVTKKLLILQTHFSTADTDSPNTVNKNTPTPTWLQKVFAIGKKEPAKPDKYNLSEISENEGLAGRWFTEFDTDESFTNREIAKWASWDNRRSFWIQREYLIQAIQEVGFDLVLEQFDVLGPNGLGRSISESMVSGHYKIDKRGTFIGVKTHIEPGGSITG